MDAKFQSSFIPKQPIISGERADSGHISIFYLASLIIFIIVLGLSVAAYFGESLVAKNIQDLNNSLVQAENSFEVGTINDLERTSERIQTAKYILDNHFSFSKFFDFLSRSTYSNVTLSQFSYTTTNGAPTVSFRGLASSFNSIILQSDLFKETKELKNATVSGFALDKDGNVSFNLTANVNPALVLYRYYVNPQQ